METPTTSIRIPQKLAKGLEKVAERTGRTRSNLIVLYIRRGLEADMPDAASSDRSDAR